MSDHLEVSTTARSIQLKPVGRLRARDYELIGPALDAFVEQHGSARILFDAGELSGVTPAAIWEDLKLGLHHRSDIDRIAIVVDGGWIERLATLAGTMSRITLKVFDHDSMDEAKAWVDGD